MQDQMNIVIVGHVDHGKSTVIGRLLADTQSLPEGKLAKVKQACALNARPFEYAFLLDALKDEQAQGITIDSARCFFQTKKRRYIIIDAPGHIEFLKNMISGAARAEAALLVIDAKEGIQENSRRHGFMLGLLGIRQVVVLVNKMDLVNYDQTIFNAIESEYRQFLSDSDITPMGFIPISAREGDCLTKASDHMPWYKGEPMLGRIDSFEKEGEPKNQPFRLPVQDVYKFTEGDDDRRIIAGTVAAGRVSVGDDVVFYPSKKSSCIQSIEGFNQVSLTHACAGEATGITLRDQIYVKSGEMMCKVTESPVQLAVQLTVRLFWMGKKPMVKEKRYKLKLCTTRAMIYLNDIHHVIDASTLEYQTDKAFVGRHDVAQCDIALHYPLPFDAVVDAKQTSRFVIIDDYDIVGGGIIINAVERQERLSDYYIKKRDYAWVKSVISSEKRAERHQQQAQFIVIAGPPNSGKLPLSKALEESLFESGKSVYYLGISNLLTHERGHKGGIEQRDEHIHRLGDMGYFMCDAGKIFISTVSDLDDFEMMLLRDLAHPYTIVLVNVGESRFVEATIDCQLAVETSISEKIDTIMRLIGT